jgi:two-component system, NarL family, nitrate/nitrite response regulator NarL
MVRPLIKSSKSTDLGLTRREREVLKLVASGYPNKDIAQTCGVSEETVKHHLTRIFDKVGASNRLELAMVATERGLLDSSDADTHSPVIEA